MKWILFYILKPLFIFENKLYCLKKQHKKINRLFCTTGNISLINAIAIINEIGNKDKYNDYLVIDTGKGLVEFYKKQLQIAKLHKFKKIIKEIHLNAAVQIVIHNLFYMDEVYILNHPFFNKDIPNLFPNAPLTLIDEGAGSLINYNSDKILNLNKFKTHKYLGKLDFWGLDDINKIKFENIDIREFKKIASELSFEYPIKYKLDANDKAILYCGIYWEVTGLEREKFIQVQSEMLQNLLDKGYKILYKPHPRDNEFFGFDKNPNVIFIDSKFPIELYNLDVVAIVSVSSTTSVTPAHYWGIPSFSNIIEEALAPDGKVEKINLIRKIISEYSPNYKELLKFDVKHTSKDKLKQDIAKIYKDFLENKPLLSENQNIKEYVRKNG